MEEEWSEFEWMEVNSVVVWPPEAFGDVYTPLTGYDGDLERPVIYNYVGDMLWKTYDWGLETVPQWTPVLPKEKADRILEQLSQAITIHTQLAVWSRVNNGL